MLKWLARSVVALVVLGLVFVYVSVGFYTVGPNEQAVVLQLGSYSRTVGPGLHWHARWLEVVEQRAVTVTVEEEFGYRTVDSGPPPVYEERPVEKRMLSGDTNTVDVEFVVQYRIVDLREYLFSIRSSAATIRDVAQAAMREVVATRPIDDVVTEAKGDIQVEARQRIQETLDRYGAGVEIQNVQLQDVEPPDEVKEAFADVASSEQDRERMVLEAQGYADQVVPLARGEAQELINTARAYRETRTQQARGEADRFSALLAEYQKAPEVTRRRLYLETLERILPHMDKVIIESGPSEKVLPYLPLGRRSREP